MIAANSASSRDASPRFTSCNSAPIAQVSGSTLIEDSSAPARTTAGAATGDETVRLMMISSLSGSAGIGA